MIFKPEWSAPSRNTPLRYTAVGQVLKYEIERRPQIKKPVWNLYISDGMERVFTSVAEAMSIARAYEAAGPLRLIPSLRIRYAIVHALDHLNPPLD